MRETVISSRGVLCEIQVTGKRLMNRIPVEQKLC
jgi:hypothetical protein